MRTDDQDARRTLVALLHHDDDGPVVGVETLTVAEALFLISTCCAKMIEMVVCECAGNNTKRALEGLDALVDGMREHIKERCEVRQ